MLAEHKADEEKTSTQTANTQNNSVSTTVNTSITQKRVTIESLRNVDDSILANQVIEFINNNPDKEDKIIGNAMKLKSVIIKYDSKTKDTETEAYSAAQVPIVGGFLKDNAYDKFADKYKKEILATVNNNSVMKDVLENYHNSKVLTDYAYEILKNKYLTEDIETNNATMKIVAITYHAIEAYIENEKETPSIGFDPGVFDVIDIISYNFSSHENAEKYKSARKALQSIYETLPIDLNHYITKDEIKNYYSSLVPKYMFPYEFEEVYLPASDDEVFTRNSVSSEERKRIYSMLNGQWTSLITGQSGEIVTFPENDKILKLPQVNFVDVLAKNEQFARFDYINEDGSKDNCFIIPAIYRNKTKVLVMYIDHSYLHFDDSVEMYKNLRFNNIKSARDVWIKKI